MTRHDTAFIASIFALATSAMADVTLGGGGLRATLDETGKVTALSSGGGSNLVDASRPGFLLMVQPYGPGKQPLRPLSLRASTVGPEQTRLVFSYDRDHEVISETTISCLPYRLPAIEGGKPQRIAVTAEAATAGTTPVIRLNLRARVPIPSGSEGI